MGWVVFEEQSGRAVKYYRSASTAKSQVTRHNNELDDRMRWSTGYNPFVLSHERKWAYCSYADYEGVLMGMNEPERKIWAFCRGKTNG
jgi:hypothetical protein